jgi:hypothetical protein
VRFFFVNSLYSTPLTAFTSRLYSSMVGLGEVVVCLQAELLKIPGLRDSPLKTAKYLRGQYTFVTLGAAVSFLSGGKLFDAFGFSAVCWLGAGISLLEFSLAIPLFTICRAVDAEPDATAIAASTDEDAMEEGGTPPVSTTASQESCVVEWGKDEELSSKDEVRNFEDDADSFTPPVRDLVRAFSVVAEDARGAAQLVWPKSTTWLLGFFVLSPAVVAMCIGTYLGTAVLYYNKVFDLSAGSTGMILGLGEAAGVLAGILVVTPAALKPRTFLPLRPTLVLVTTIFLIAIFDMAFTAPVLAIAITCQLVFQGLNDVFTGFIAEILAQNAPLSKWRMLQSRGQTFRRLGNAISGLCGPILLGVWAPLPFLVAAGIALCWAFLLLVSLGIRGKQLLRNIRPDILKDDGCFHSWYQGLMAVSETDKISGVAMLPRLEVQRELGMKMRPLSKRVSVAINIV